MKIYQSLILLIAGFIIPHQLLASTATLTEWGTLVNTVSGSCPGDTCTPLDVLIAGINPETTVDGSNQSAVATGPVSTDQGTAKASASVTGSVATPVLKAQASASAGNWIGAGAFAIQGYEYTGLIGETLNLDILFDGNISNPDGDTATGFGVGMYLFTPEQIGFDSLSNDPYTALGNLAIAGSGLAVEQKIEWDITVSGVVNELAQLSLFLNPGDQFYIAGGLLAAAGGNGAVADAFSTLTVAIDPSITDDLQAAGDAAAVPLPASIWLFIPAIFGLLKKKIYA